MNGTIYTIGYSGFSIEDFVKKIKNNNINCVIDVRSSPFSKYFPQYNKEFVKKYLNNNNILYMNFLEFGARQTDPKFFNPKGYLDFEKYTQSLSFLHGTERVVNGIAKGYNIALMCAEKEPSHCHRTIMISRWFSKNDFNIIHFMPNNIRNKKQKDLDVELLMHFFKKDYSKKDNSLMRQRSLFEIDSGVDTQEEKIDEAYRLQNAIIGFKQEDGEG